MKVFILFVLCVLGVTNGRPNRGGFKQMSQKDLELLEACLESVRRGRKGLPSVLKEMCEDLAKDFENSIGVTDDYKRGLTDEYDRGVTDDYKRGATDEYDRGVTDDYKRGATDEYDRGVTDDYKRGATNEYDRGVTDDYKRGATDEYDRGVTADYKRGATDDYKRGVTDKYDRGVTDDYEKTDDPISNFWALWGNSLLRGSQLNKKKLMRRP